MSSHPNRTPFDGQAPTREFHETDYRRWLRRQSKAGNWFMFQRLFLSVMSSDASTLAQSLINLAKEKADDDGWVMATTGYLKETLFMGRKRVEKTLRELRLRGFVDTRTIGYPRKRFIRVNLEAINAAIDRNQNISTCVVCPDVEPSQSPHTCAIKDKGINPTGNTTYSPGGADGETPSRRTPDSPGSTHPSTTVKERGTPPVNPPRLATCPSSPQDRAAKCPVEGIDRARAKRLKDYVRQNGWYVSASPKKWEQAMSVLRRNPATCATQIDSVLDYVINRHPKDAAPRIRNARELIDRWDWLNDLMEKAERNKPVPISGDAQDIVRRLSRLHWPKDSESQLPQAVQKSLDEFKEFQGRLKRFVDADPKTKQARNVHGFARRVYNRYLNDAEWFIHGFWEKKNRRIRGWDDWSGRLDPHFHPSMLSADGHGWSEEYSGHGKDWDTLMEEIYREG